MGKARTAERCTSPRSERAPFPSVSDHSDAAPSVLSYRCPPSLFLATHITAYPGRAPRVAASACSISVCELPPCLESFLQISREYSCARVVPRQNRPRRRPPVRASVPTFRRENERVCYCTPASSRSRRCTGDVLLHWAPAAARRPEEATAFRRRSTDRTDTLNRRAALHASSGTREPCCEFVLDASYSFR